MWFDILKDSKQVSRTVGGIDWEKETIPEKDEPKCKEKLLAIQKALKDWNPPNSKYHGGKHVRGSNISTNYRHQDFPFKEYPNITNDQDWIENKYEDYSRMIIQYDSHWIKNLSEEEACAFLEKLKKFNFNSNELFSDTPISLIAVSTGADFPIDEPSTTLGRPHSIIRYKGKEGVKIFYQVIMGNNDKDYTKSTIRELQAFIKQQL
tara:strand:- start:571 stop:1191 length:621 start_codon:yes stop_codon:yes gene_type:complete